MIKWICRALLLAGLVSGGALAQAPANPGIVVTDMTGTLRYRIGDSEPQTLAKGQAIPIGARVTTGVDSRAMLTFPDGQVVVLGPMSRLIVREFVYLPTDLARSRVLINLTDGSIYIQMGAIGQSDPSLIQIQVGTKITPQSVRRAPGKDTGVIVLGSSTMVQVAQGSVSMLVASSEQSFALGIGARALVQSDGSVRMGTPAQVDGQAATSPEGKIMLGQMEILQRDLPSTGRPIAFFVTTPLSEDLLQELAAGGRIFPVTTTVPTAATGAGGGGLPCAASCN